MGLQIAARIITQEDPQTVWKSKGSKDDLQPRKDYRDLHGKKLHSSCTIMEEQKEVEIRTRVLRGGQ